MKQKQDSNKKNTVQGNFFDNEKKERKGGRLQKLGDVLSKYEKPEKNKYVSREFQDYGYRLAMELNDEKHKALYIRLAKKEDRGLLEKARSFVVDAGAKKPGALFMWKLKELKQAEKSKK